MKKIVVVTDDRFNDYTIELSVLNDLDVDFRVENCVTEDDVAQSCKDADVVLANMAPVGANAISSMKRCKAICRYGTGLDNINLEAAAQKGIAVLNVSGYCDDEVAEHAMALMFDVSRSITLRDRFVRSGGWRKKFPAFKIRGSVLGVLGFGNTAKAFISKCTGLGFREILVWSPNLDKDRLSAELKGTLESMKILGTEIRCVPSEMVFAHSDVISVNIKLTEDTRGFIDRNRIASMKPGAILINVARGSLIDESALIEALESGALSGAGLDVFSIEPLPMYSRLRLLPNVVITPHAAWYSPESLMELKRRTAINALRYLG